MKAWRLANLLLKHPDWDVTVWNDDENDCLPVVEVKATSKHDTATSEKMFVLTAEYDAESENGWPNAKR